MLTVMQDDNTGWVLLVCGLYGCFIALLVRAGGAQAISFTTGSNWGVFAIAIPVVFPLAAQLDVSVPLMAGALFSASGFGSQACFYSDSTVLTAQGSGCGSFEHAMSQLPYALIAAGLSAVGFLLIS